ncbi:hypothetical protein [Algoriphagus sp.]|uniref:hypothetical protein n=1 Tax=Algoriphagus sp. TaxID=1872435 RepID=UPI00391A03D6
MKNIIYFIIATAFYTNAIAQEATTNGTPPDERFGFSVGYFGDMIRNPGYFIGLENYLATTKNYQVIGSVIFTNYFLKQNFTALSLNPRIGLRYTSNFGITLESHLGLGYLHRFYRFDDYDVNEQGEIVSKGKASQISAMPNLAVGLGYDFRRKTNLPLLYFLRGSINYNYPNRHFLFEASIAIETGITYVPKFGKSK